jgi:hypothetical protein
MQVDNCAEARRVALAAAALIKPLPQDEEKPLAGEASHDDLVLRLAYQEAKAMIQLDETVPPKGQTDTK